METLEEQNEIEITSSQLDQVDGEVSSSSQVPKVVPYYRVKELSAEKNELKNTVERLKKELENANEKAGEYQRFLDALNTPAFAASREQLAVDYSKLMGFDEEMQEQEVNGEELRENEAIGLSSRISSLEQQLLANQWDRELEVIQREVQQLGLNVTEEDIYKTMETYDIASPSLAWKVLQGEKLHEILKGHEAKLRENLIKTPAITPKEKIQKLATPTPTTLEDAKHNALQIFRTNF